MIRIEGSDLYKLLKQLARIQATTKDAPEVVASLSEDFPQELRAQWRPQLAHYIKLMEGLGARISIRCAEELLKKVARDDHFPTYQFFEGIRDLESTLRREMQDVTFYSISPAMADLLETSEPLFGDEVLIWFPSAASDIAEAGKCLALKRNKAAVFHLMLAMECALREMATHIKADLLNKHGQLEKWSVLVSRIKEKIPALPAKEQDDWTSAHNLLWGVGKVWRNGTMHPAEAYSDEEAEKIFAAVKTFMQHLAPLVAIA
ncbi:MAG: hypothetical protein Q8R82_00045 [Hyphomonadaceae bacterium]|nr:hypothetical protein [Hyphomonadaceae bacterium]